MIRKIAWMVLLVALPAMAGAAGKDAYTSFRNARPAGDGIAVKELSLDRDVHHFSFHEGSFFFLPPVEGRTVGAVFIGNGSWNLTPATEGERKHLELLVGEKGLKSLGDTFDSAVFLFTDSTANEIRTSSAGKAAFDTRATDAFERFFKQERTKFRANFHVRILEDVLNAVPAAEGAFLAFPDGRRYSDILAGVDPGGSERLRLGGDSGDETTLLYRFDPDRGGFWYLSARRDAPGARVIPVSKALRYVIDTEIEKNVRCKGTTTIEFQTSSPVRMLDLHLLPKLRLEDVSFARGGSDRPDWKPAEFIQENEEEDATAAVILPETTAVGSGLFLRLKYSGKEVLSDAGDGNYSVRARESWYPNFGAFREPASFELTYRIPKDRDVVSVGEPAGETVDGATKVSVWKTGSPIRVAGFNYGKFKILEKKDELSGFELQVFTNPGRSDVVHELGKPIYPEALAESTLVDGINAARVCTAYFGPLPYHRVAITQQSQWSFGQSWPALIYLPFLAFVDAGMRTNLGLGGAKDFVDEVGYHEFAHQWWGHLVGWKSYRDAWLSEGFAEFSAGLALENTGGSDRADKFWEHLRKAILETPRGSSIANSDAGPINLGSRLETFRDPDAYDAIVYRKGAYVLHMLQMAMRDAASKEPDHAFIELMKDFAATWAGRNPSTADFQAMAEKHLIPALNATRDGKLDWFFRQWVYGTEIPKYQSKLSIESSGGGKYRITGSLAQRGVSKDFRALVPLYLDFGKGKLGRFGVLPMIGEMTVPVSVEIALPSKPRAVVPNAMHDVLARD